MKKIASLLAAVMLLTATLAGCGNSGSGSSTTDTSSASSTASQSSAAEDSSAAEGETSSEASATEAGDYGEFTTIEEGKLIHQRPVPPLRAGLRRRGLQRHRL